MIDGHNFFDWPVKNNSARYNNIQKIATGQGDYYKTGCLLDFPYTKEVQKILAIDLSKEQALHANPKAIEQINFFGNLDQAGNTMFSVIEEAKETIFDFSQGTVRGFYLALKKMTQCNTLKEL